MKRLTLVLVLLLNGCAAVCHGGWTRTDTALEVTAMGVTAIDEQQTEFIARHGDRFYEMNPLLGAHPNVGAVQGYFALALLHPVLACLLSPPLRRSLQIGTIAVEGITVLGNDKTGIRMIRK